MPPPRGEGMTGSPPSGPALPMRARARDPTGARSSHPTHSPDRLTSFRPPPSQASAQRQHRRQGPAAADAVGPTGPILDPDAATGAAQKRRRTKEKRSTSRGTAQLDRSSPFRDDSAGSPTSAHPAGGQLSGWPSRSMGGVGRPGGGRHPADLPRDYHCERLVTLIQRKRNYH